jgi:carotenoid 1,2-hydratase
VAPGGYLWWYIDASSDDGQMGLTMIAFVGSVFSPYYAWSRRRGAADPDNFCCLNVALYSRHARRWSMTERGRRQCLRDATRFVIGPSQLHWDGRALDLHIDEVCTPIPQRIRGHIRITPQRLFSFSTALDPKGLHRWGPIAPSARIEVRLREPEQRWSGQAYLDSNEGDEPIESAFHQWDWSRSLLADGSTAVLYDMQYANRQEGLLALRFDTEGGVQDFEAPARQVLPATRWRVARRMRSSAPVQIQEQLEDTPFYQRALLRSELLGEPVRSFHESLSIPRLVSPLVRAMLPWRMPRRS